MLQFYYGCRAVMDKPELSIRCSAAPLMFSNMPLVPIYLPIVIQNSRQPFRLIYPRWIIFCFLHQCAAGRANLMGLVAGGFAGRADILIGSEQVCPLRPVRWFHSCSPISQSGCAGSCHAAPAKFHLAELYHFCTPITRTRQVPGESTCLIFSKRSPLT